MSLSGTVARVAAGGVALGALTTAYAVLEAHSYRLRRIDVPVLPPGQPELRVLHLSDLHMTPRHSGRAAWIADLDRLDPHLVVVTGDFLAHLKAVPFVLDALAPLLLRPGLFTLGSNDYWAPRFKDPTRYLRADDGRRSVGTPLPWNDLVDGLVSAGWHDLDNRRSTITVDGRTLDTRGTDDPHIRRDRYDEVAGPFAPDADLRLGVTHAPYLRVIDAMAADGADLLLAGHTHGGQICVPGYGALVTNCDLEPSRAKGLSRQRDSMLHVSAGLGTSPFTPVRIACPPEATLLTLQPRPA